MPTPRGKQVDAERGSLHHCIVRCVRRARLCGEDPLSGASLDHRKAWIRDRLALLTEVFAVRLAGYAIMENHLHLVIRTEPRFAAQLADEEVARRWLRLFPPKRNGERVEADEQDIADLCASAERLCPSGSDA